MINHCFSLRYLQNEAEVPGEVIRSPLSKHQRSNSLSEISDNKIFNIGIREVGLNKVKLPSLDHVRPLQKRKLFNNTTSLDNCKYYTIET